MQPMKYVFWAFLALYVAALAIYLVGTLGLFGQQPDPLSGAFLMPLGLPWNLLLDRLAGPSAAAAALAPLVNLAILYWLWRR
jgi:hypothetical protein